MGITLDEAMAFVEDHRMGVLVTARRDGRPQLSNIMYVPGPDRTLRISVTDSRAKTANLRRNPQASLHVSSADFWAYVVLDGTVALSGVAQHEDDEVGEPLATMYRQAQGEHPDWAEFRRAMVAQGRLVATFTPDRAYGMPPA